MDHNIFVGLDVHKKSTSVALAEAGRGGEVRFYGEIPTTPEALRRLVDKLGRPDRRLHFCYEAGPCGYGTHRLLRGLGQDCIVVAPSLIPSRRADGSVGAGRRARSDARSGPRPRHGAPGARQGSPTSPRFPFAPRSGLHRQTWLDPSLSAMADHGALRPSRPADRAAGLHPCRR